MASCPSKRLKLQSPVLQKSEDEQSDHEIEVPKRKIKTDQSSVLQASSSMESNAADSILILNDDCFFALLQRMGLDDVCAMSETCTRLQTICTDHFGRCYKEKMLVIDSVPPDGKSMVTSPKNEKYVECFAKHMTNVTLSNNFSSTSALQRLDAYCKEHEMASFKQIRFEKWSQGMRKVHGPAMAEMVKEVESVTFSATKLFDDLNKCILQFMPKMKELTLWNRFTEPNDEKVNWMEQNYPNLQRFVWHLTKQEVQVPKLKQFLTVNPNITFISLHSSSFETVNNLIAHSVRINELFFEFKFTNFSATFDALQTLCEHQLCNDLHLKFDNPVRSSLKQNHVKLVSLAPFIKGLYFEKDAIDAELANILVTFEHLKVLQFKIARNAAQLITIPSLEEVYIPWAVNSSNFQMYNRHLLIAARRSPNLKRIYLRNNSQRFDRFAFAEMDTERRRLVGAQKLKIYFKSGEPKRMGRLNDITRNYEMVEIVRVETEPVRNPLVSDYLTTKDFRENASYGYRSRRYRYF